MIKTEYKYFGVILSVFLISIATLAILLRKYTLLTFQHFIETCQQMTTSFFSSGTHFIGLALVVLTVLVASIFCVKTFFSLLKTQKQIKTLLINKTDYIPEKLQRVLDKIVIDKDKVIVINKRSTHAFSFGFKSPSIILSKGLINKLTPKQLEAVVLHEKYHLDNQHSLVLIISETISSTLFFLPLVKELNIKIWGMHLTPLR